MEAVLRTGNFYREANTKQWIALLLMPLILLFSAWTCQNQQVIAGDIKVVATSLRTLATIDTANASTYNQAADLMDQASTLYANWKPGAPSDQITQALAAAETLVASVQGVSPMVKQLVTLALGTIQIILNSFPKKALIGVKRTAAPVTLSHPPKNADDYRSQWNQIADQLPDAAKAKI